MTTTTTTYRTIGIDEAPYGTLSAPMVVVDGWAHSVWTSYPEPGVETANVRRHDADGNVIERHPTLDGAVYPMGTDEPRRLAYEAGILAYFVREA